MSMWFDRRLCIICNHPPTEISVENIPQSFLQELTHDPLDFSSLEPSTSPNISHDSLTAISNQGLSSEDNRESSVTLSSDVTNKDITTAATSVTVRPLLQTIPENTIDVEMSTTMTVDAIKEWPPIQIGDGATYKCRNCAARCHLCCLDEAYISRNASNDRIEIICPICVAKGNTIDIHPKILKNYRRLDESLDEEKNLLRDWNSELCLSCGMDGELLMCDLCYWEHNSGESGLTEMNEILAVGRTTRSKYRRMEELAAEVQKKKEAEQNMSNTMFITGDPKIDCAGQFHLQCGLLSGGGRSNTIILPTDKPKLPRIDSLLHPDYFICPLCSNEYGSNRLNALLFFQRRRMQAREKKFLKSTAVVEKLRKELRINFDEIKTCALCRKAGDDTSQGVFFDQENEFVGPFYDERNPAKKLWVHYQCALWAPQVYLEDDKYLINVHVEIQRSRGLLCSVCHKHGAVIGCYENGCSQSYHYPCAKEAQCYFDEEEFAIFCPQHYFVHFLATNASKAKQHRIKGMKRNQFEKSRFETTLQRKRKLRSVNARDFVSRYKSSAEVWKLMNQQNAGGRVLSVLSSRDATPMSAIDDTPLKPSRYNTRAQQKKIEAFESRVTERRKRKQRQSLMRIGLKARKTSALTGATGEETFEMRHEAKRRKQFGIEPMTLNSKSLGMDFEPERIDDSDEPMCDISDMVGGLGKAIQVLKETILLPLVYPDLFSSYGLRPAKGVLLYGPPGTGKTLLVRSLIKYYHQMSKMFKSPSASVAPQTRSQSVDSAKELQSVISFFNRRGPDLLSRYHGETERNLRSLFQRAEECAPSIIFFDEIDGMCPARSPKQDQVHNSTVATLLSLMDGLEESNNASRVFVIAATNRIDNLDPALRRPGRFDREIFVGLPSAKARKDILKIHMQQWPNAKEMLDNSQWKDYLSYLSHHKTVGFSGADLKALCHETLLFTVRKAFPNLCEATERDESVAKKLSKIQVTQNDFESVLASDFKSSSRRSDLNMTNFCKPSHECDLDKIESVMAVLSSGGRNALEFALKRIQVFIDVNQLKNNDCDFGYSFQSNDNDSNDNDSDVEMKESSPLDTDTNSEWLKSSNVRSLLLHHYRLVVSGNERESRLILGSLLYRLDSANIQYITFPELISQASIEDVYQIVMDKVKQCLRSKIGVIVIPDIDCWLKQWPSLIEHLLTVTLRSVSSDRSFVVLCTSKTEWNSSNCWECNWPSSVYKYFSSFQHHVILQ